MRQRTAFLVAGGILALLLACAVIVALGVGLYLSYPGPLDVPYHDEPPTPIMLP